MAIRGRRYGQYPTCCVPDGNRIPYIVPSTRFMVEARDSTNWCKILTVAQQTSGDAWHKSPWTWPLPPSSRRRPGPANAVARRTTADPWDRSPWT